MKKQIAWGKKKSPVINFHHAEHIAILYDATFIEKEPPIHKYVGELKAQGKKVYTIGYVDMPNLPGNKKFSLQNDFCWHEKLSFFGLPRQQVYETFLKTEFDLLLNLYESPVLPLLALSAWSKSKFKAGPEFADGLLYYDAIIRSGETPTLGSLITQLDYYLKAIT